MIGELSCKVKSFTDSLLSHLTKIHNPLSGSFVVMNCRVKLNFNDFWTLIEKSGIISLETPKRRKEFTMIYISSHDLVEVTPSTTFVRPIPKSQFKNVWQIAKTVVNPFSQKQYHNVTYHSSYIIAIIKHFVKMEKIE